MVMMINELNTGLIEALKEKLPPKTNLANLLMDTLYIGREAIYRRLLARFLSPWKRQLLSQGNWVCHWIK